MTLKVKHIVLIIGLFLAETSVAQHGWTVTPQANSMRIWFDAATIYDTQGFTLEPGDVIAVFYLNDSAAGMVTYTGGSDTMYVYGSSDPFFPTGGFLEGGALDARIWDSSEACTIENVVLQFAIGETAYFTNAFRAIGNVVAQYSSMWYPYDYYCKEADGLSGIPAPFKGGIISDGLSFGADPVGLDIHFDSGFISTSQSEPGDYEIKFSTGTCLMSSTFDITIAEHFQDSLSLELTALADCEDSLEFTVDSAYFERGTPFFVFNAQELTGPFTQLGLSPTFKLDTGEYQIIITDEQICQDTMLLEVIPDPECSADPTLLDKYLNYPVITPELNFDFDDYTIDCGGIIQIYDRYGQLQKELPAGAQWDGTDQNGDLLGTGDYHVFCENERIKIVTVIR